MNSSKSLHADVSLARSCFRIGKCERRCERRPSRLDPRPISTMVASTCGINSAVECQLPKLKVASSNLVSRSKFQIVSMTTR